MLRRSFPQPPSPSRSHSWRVAQTAEPAKPAAPPAAAPAPLVQVYGTLNVNLQYTEASGATAANADVSPRFAISTDSTNIGVRGALDLGFRVQGRLPVRDPGEPRRRGHPGPSATATAASASRPSGARSSSGTGTRLQELALRHEGRRPVLQHRRVRVPGPHGQPGYGVRSAAFNSSAVAAVTASFDQRARTASRTGRPSSAASAGRSSTPSPSSQRERCRAAAAPQRGRELRHGPAVGPRDRRVPRGHVRHPHHQRRQHRTRPPRTCLAPRRRLRARLGWARSR